MIEKLDVNDDGKINLEEFSQIFIWEKINFFFFEYNVIHEYIYYINLCIIWLFFKFVANYLFILSRKKKYFH